MAGSYTRRINLYINGKEVKNDIASIRKEMQKLSNQQAHMTRGSEEYLRTGAQVKRLKGILQEHNESLRDTGKAWYNLTNLANGFNKYFGVITSFIAGFGSALYMGKQAITSFAQFDDKLTDVMKTTGLTKVQVKELNEELKKLNTRSAQEDLLNLARIAGKLGITAKEDILGFVRASDKISVALKEDLGGSVEDAVGQLGKLVDVFKLKEKFGIEESLLKVGSALNELGMASTANEAYLVEFAKRTAGIAPMAGVSIQSILGLAATLDSLGQTSEVSATAYSKLMTTMAKKTEVFAKIAGMSMKEFSTLMKKDANEAMIRVFEGIGKNSGGLEEMVAALGDLGLEGQRMTGVFGVLANNTKTLREQQNLSNKAFAEGTSLTNEFNTKNNNAQAELEKRRKGLSNLTVELGQKLMPILTISTSGMSYFVKALMAIMDFAGRNSRAIISLAYAIGIYTVAVKLSTLWQARNTEGAILNTLVTKAKTIATNVATAATQLYAAATMLLTGNIKGAGQAMRVFNSLISKNLFGILATGLIAAIAYFQVFKNKVKEATDYGEVYKESLKRQVAELNNEKSALHSLINQIIQTNTETELRHKLIDKLKKEYPGYLDFLSTEKITNAQLLGVLQQVNSTYDMKYKLAALNARRESSEKKLVDIESRKLEIEERLQQIRSKAIMYGSDDDKEQRSLSAELRQLAVDAKTAKTAINDLDKKQNDIKNAIETATSTSLDALNKRLATALNSIKITKSQLEKAVDTKDESFYKEKLSNYETERDNLLAQIKFAEEEEKRKKEESKTITTTPTGGPSKGKYSLSGDILFLKESLILKEKFRTGDIKSEEEYQELLRKLEIRFLENRLASKKDNKEDTLQLQDELANKRLEARKAELKREDDLQKSLKKTSSPIETENREYEERLIALGLFGRERSSLTALELAALENQEAIHADKLSKIDADLIREEVEQRQRAFDTRLASMKLAHDEELDNITTLEDAKAILATFMSDEELAKIKTLNQAKLLLQKNQQKEEAQITEEHLRELLRDLQTLYDSGQLEGLNLSDSILSEEEKNELIDKLNQVKQKLRESGLLKKEGKEAKEFNPVNVDILGFSSQDWKDLDENLKAGTAGIQGMQMAVQALGSVWTSLNNYINVTEQAKLDKAIASNDRQKKILEERFNKGLIGQEEYNKKIQDLDKDTDRKKAKFERDRAIRERNVALMSAIVNTAASIAKVLWNPVLAFLVGAAGALQIGTIMATPLPEIPGLDAGGSLSVIRQQDKKRFNAAYEPDKRGWIGKPTVITGERPGSREYVIPDEALDNPTIRPLVNLLERSRLAKNLPTVDMHAAYVLQGRQSGGYVKQGTGNTTGAVPQTNQNGANNDSELIPEAIKVMRAVLKKLEDPLEAYVTLYGPRGIKKTMDEDEELTNNATF